MATPGEGPGAVVGRHAELAALRGPVEDLAAGRGRAVLLEGEPGIGKTALLDAVLATVRAAGLPVHAAACLADQQTPLAVLCEALGLPAGARTEATEAGGGLAGDDPVAAAAQRVLARVDLLCATGPLMLAVDDLHAADDATLLVWQRLCALTGRAPLLLLGTCRPVPRRTGIERVRRILSDHGGLRLPVRGLDPGHAAELVGRMLGGAPGPLLSARLGEAAGNPHYLRELTDSLMRANAVTVHGGSAELAADGAQAGPGPGDGPADVLATAITDLLAFLGAPALDVLRAAALLGPEFAVTDLSRVLGRPAGALAGAVQEAVAAGVLDPAGPRLRFRHGLLRQALHASVPAPRRIALRRAAMRALVEDGSSVERVAGFLAGDLDAFDDEATVWVADNAVVLARQAPDAAMELFAQALRRPIEPWRRVVLRGELAEVAFRLARYEQAAALCARTCAEEQDTDLRGRAVWIWAHALAGLGRPDQATRLVRAMAIEPTVSELWRARLTAKEALTMLAGGRTAEAGRAAERAAAAGERLADPMTVAFALYAAAALRRRAGDAEGCAALAERALAAAGNDARLTELRLTVKAEQAAAFAELDRFDRADEVLRAARSLAERSGGPVLACCRVAEAELAYLRGAWDAALAALGAAQGPAGAVSRPADASTVAGIRALIAARRGAEEPPDNVATPPSPCQDSGYALLARALAAEREAGPARAATVLRVVLEPGYTGLSQRSMVLPALVRAALACGDVPLAEAAGDAARIAAELTPPRASAAARWCDALLADDPERLAAVTGYLRRTGRRAELACALEDAAVLAARTGRIEQAGRAAAEALEAHARLGADADGRRAAERLRAAGIRVSPSGRPRTGWDALTATELRVAELVGQGRSNPDIAAALRLSRRTVETHVSHILAKLGARSRREIAAARSGTEDGTSRCAP